MWTTIIIPPIYNALIYIVNLVPGNYLWVAVCVLTILIKLILLPLYKKQVKDQLVMTHLAPKLKTLQEKLKNKKEDLAKETMALYSKYKVNPFISILILFIQLPFLIGLYRIFLVDLATRENLLYPFVQFPPNINHMFLWLSLTEKSLFLGVVAGISQYILGTYMFTTKTGIEAESEPEFARAMQTQMKYFLPIVITFVSTITPSVISLYIIVGNIFMVFQEIWIKKPLEIKVKKELES